MSHSQLAATACLLVSAFFLAGGMGDIQPPVAAWFGLTGLAAYTCYCIRASRGCSPLRARFLAAAIIVGAVAAFLPQQGLAVLTVAALVAAIRLALTFRPAESDMPDRHLLWSALFALASVLYRQEPYCRSLTEEVCRLASGLLAAFLGESWAPASTAAGWQAILAYVLLVAVTIPRVPRGRRLTALAAAFTLLLASVSIYAASASFLANFYQGSAHYAALPDRSEMTHAGQHQVAPFTWITPLAAMYPMSFQPILIGLLLASYGIVVKSVSPSPANARETDTERRRPERGTADGAQSIALGRIWRKAVLVSAMATAIGSAFLIWPPEAHYARPDTLRVLVHRQHLDWRAPQYGSYGDRSGGMFGLLAEHLAAHGHNVTAEPIDDDTNLPDIDVLVLINLQEYFSERLKEKILAFVHNGGGLLIAGDHTGVNGLREPANHLVGDLGIELNFDSAKPFSSGWTDGFDFMSHPVTRGQPWWFNEANIWVGASLTVRPPAYPIVIGRYAFSDPGDMTNPRGYLGDMKYSRGERLGDLPLVAAREYGHGRIIVWGDTSPLQNMAWTFSHDYMQRTLCWLGARKGNLPSWFRMPMAVVLFVSVTGVLMLTTANRRAIVAAAMALGLLGLIRVADAQKPDQVARGARAYIDVAHLPDANLDLWLRDGFAGMAQTMARSRLLPYALTDWEKQPLEAARLLVFVSPIKPLDAREEERLLAFVRGGAHVLVCLGWEESAGWRPFLKRLGLEIINSPLGQLDGESWAGKTVHLQNAWPVAARNGQETAFDFRPLVTVRGQPCATRGQAPGGGSFTLVGDSRFLRNVNLEGRFECVEANIDFYRTFVESYVYQNGSDNESIAASDPKPR